MKISQFLSIKGVIMKYLNKLFTLLLFSFFLTTQTYAITYEDAEPTNDSCPGEDLSTIVSGTTNFTGVLEKAGALPGIDYSQMSIPSDGNLSIRWTGTGKTASFLVGSSCNDATYYNGSSAAGTHNVSTFSVNAGDIIYLKIYNGAGGNDTGRGYNIEIDYTIDTPDVGPNLNITKIDSNDPVEIDQEFYYIIDVLNTGSETSSGVTVIDTLPLGVDMNKTKTEAASPWTCNQILQVVTCVYDNSSIPSGGTETIYLHVNAPSLPGVITNDVNVTDNNGTTDSASEETTITAEIENADNLCYIENTLASGLNADINASCKKEGNFYYGNIGGQDDCVAQVIIYQDSNVSTDPITNLVVTKMYAPGLTSAGSAVATGGLVLNSGSKTTLNFESFTSYTEGYKVQVDDLLTTTTNVTITDTASDYNPNMNGIAIYADYNISHTHHFGRVYACDGGTEGGIEINFSVDAIDTAIRSDSIIADQYNTSVVPSVTGNDIKYIRTMVAASPTRTIEGVHLDTNGNTTPYTPTNPDFNFIISPILINDTCDGGIEPLYEPGTTNPAFIIVPNNAYSAAGAIEVPSTVRKSARLQLIAIDPDSLSVEGQQCILSSSADGNFAGVPSCANSEVQYSNAFGQDAWDRCGISGGKPCEPSNHGVADTSDPTYNPDTDSIYVNDYGCYLCTFNVAPVCSTDNFSIRPDKFNTTIVETNTPTHAPNLLRSGQDYNTSLTALNADSAVSTSYTVLNFDTVVDTPTPKKYFNGPTPWVEDTSGLLHGSAVPTPISPSYIINGQSRLSNSPGSAEPVVGVTFDDVGRVGIYVADINWSQVDNDDTPMDCNSSEHTYICGELNATFIPHHFGFAELNITNQNGPDSNFTYIADNRGMPSATPPTRSPMAARVHTRIEARNQQDGITQNFREDFGGNLYYENNISVTQTVSIPTARSLPAEPNAYVFGADANESEIDDKLVGFGRTTGPETDNPGTRNVKWNEATYPIEFNFHREINKPANPFDVNGTYYAISATSTYIDPDDEDTAIIDGSRVGDANASVSPCVAPPAGTCVNANAENNATFYYGRARPTQTMYDDVSTSSVTTPIAIDVYCDLLFSECDAFGINTTNAKTNEVDWWLSLNHVENSIQHDGNITLQRSPAGSAIVRSNATGTEDPAEVRIVSEGIDRNVVVTATSSTRPLTIDIDLVHNILPVTLPNYTATPPYTNSWLIYNKDTPTIPSPFYRVRFIGTSGWAGHGDTGHVVDSNVSTKKNRRLGW